MAKGRQWYYTLSSPSKRNLPWASSFGAANQLSISLSYALGRIRQLRTDAGAITDEKLYLFGAISSGSLWNVYIAYEANPSAVNMQSVGHVHLKYLKLIVNRLGCLQVLVKIWYGDVTDPHAALEFVWIVERIRQWALLHLKAILTGWLEVLRPSVPGAASDQ